MIDYSKRQLALTKIRAAFPKTHWQIEVHDQPLNPNEEEYLFSSSISGTYLSLQVFYYAHRDTCHCFVMCGSFPIWSMSLAQLPLELALIKLKAYLESQVKSINQYLNN